jgi:ubiquinone/menaquinone biosynthesis C-methylase UbiE
MSRGWNLLKAPSPPLSEEQGVTTVDSWQTLIETLVQEFLRRYARSEADAIAPFLVGSRLLDLGAGEGYVAAALRQQTDIWICAVDVGPYERTPGPYVIYDGARLPFDDATFDTTLISLALHHSETPEEVLDEALRVTRSRLIILESVYRNRWERFCLEWLDDWCNRLRHKGKMHVALAFKDPQEWQRLFDMRHLRTVDRRWLGSWWERVVHQPLLYVLEKAAPRGTAGNGHRGTGVSGERESDHAGRRHA